MIVLLAMLRSFAITLRKGLADPKFRAMAYLVALLLLIGTVFYTTYEDWTVLDSLYFSVITLTTVGFGDLAPTTALTRSFTILYILMGLGILFSFLSLVAGHAAEARMERQEHKKDKS
ncbi:MAG: two pore domain potassium channel family protein [bacterium]|nr:two pore domain potassium channel family protein [bacterium]MCP4968883.1 two pore domain potassium channel family protein [bacterium]